MGVRKKTPKVVEKKPIEISAKDLSMRMASLRTRVREAIIHLPPDTQGETQMARNKGTKKEANGKATTSKKSESGTTLAQICKECKVEPRAARRRLRNSDLSHEGRWEWNKASDVARVKKILSEPTKAAE